MISRLTLITKRAAQAVILVLLSSSAGYANSVCKTENLASMAKDFVWKGNISSDDKKVFVNDASKWVNSAASQCTYTDLFSGDEATAARDAEKSNDTIRTIDKSTYEISCKILSVRQLASQSLSILRQQISESLGDFDRLVLTMNQACLQETVNALPSNDENFKDGLNLAVNMSKTLAEKTISEVVFAIDVKPQSEISTDVADALASIFKENVETFEDANKKLTPDDVCKAKDSDINYEDAKKISHLCAPGELTGAINEAESQLLDASVSDVISRIKRLAEENTSDVATCMKELSAVRFNGKDASEWQKNIKKMCKSFEYAGLITTEVAQLKDWGFLSDFLKNPESKSVSEKLAMLNFMGSKDASDRRLKASKTAEEYIEDAGENFDKGVCRLKHILDIEVSPEEWSAFDEETTLLAKALIRHYTDEQCNAINKG